MDEISLCMIIMDESKILENCLNSAKDLADEIIIVDTGSKDNSKEIAKRFTDKVYDFKWRDDFSKARNFSISMATKHWILILDADEVIAGIDKEKIRKIIELSKADAFYFNWRDYVNATGFYGWISSKEDKYKESSIAQGFYNSKVLRFFKNKKQYFFEGKIHETPYNSIIKNNGKIFDTDIVIHHFGNLDNEKFIEKRKKYIELLKQRIKNKDFKEKAEDYVYFEIANELTNIRELKEAILFYEKAIEINEIPLYLLGLGALYIHEKQYDNAEQILKKAVILEPQNPAIHNNLGVIYVEKKEYNKAIRKYERAIELKPDFADAYFNLGIVYRLNGKLNKVDEFFEKAIELNPGFKERIENLSRKNEKNEVIDVNKSRIFNDLVEYTNLHKRKVLQKCADAEEELAELWGKKKSILDFYQNTDLYLFDLTKYQLILEARQIIEDMVKQIKALKLKKILEYGGGIGEFSLFCYENELDISYYDLDGKTKKYALWRFKKHNCEVIIENDGGLDKKWDIINIMDVLEHLENPNEVIEKLKKNARYILCNPNEIQYNEFCPQHISKFDLTKDFEHINGYLWKNKYL